MVLPELERLLLDLVPFAKESLNQGGEFEPFGGTITAQAELEHVAVDHEDAAVSDEESVATLESNFRAGAERGAYIAIAIFCDVRLCADDSEEEIDAIQVVLEHVSGTALLVFIPYRTSDDGQIEYGDYIPKASEPCVFVA